MCPSIVSSEAVTRPRSRLKVAAAQIAELSASRKRDSQEPDLYEARFHALVRAVADGVWTTDAQGQVVAEILGWSAFTGQSPAQMSGAGWSGALHPDDRQRVLEAWYQAVRDGATRFETEYRLRRHDGEYRDVWVRGAPVSVHDERAYEWLGIWSDVTERKNQAEVLRKGRESLDQLVAARTVTLATMTTQLRASVDELEAFAYSVSHDLRAPLRAIDGFSRIVLDEYADKLDDEGRRLLGVVCDATTKMGQLIDDILRLSRTSRMDITLRRVDMGELVGGVLASELSSVVTGRELAIEIGELPEAWGDAVLLRHVWLNLLDNAIKFTVPKPHARIEIGATAGTGETIYFVGDTGVGFDMRYAHKLFGAFQRLHGSEFPGTGVGLAIVKRIVTRHGGRVWAESKVGEGATFFFALPTKGST